MEDPESIHLHRMKQKIMFSIKEHKCVAQDLIKDAKIDLLHLEKLQSAATDKARMSRKALEGTMDKIRTVENRLAEEDKEKTTWKRNNTLVQEQYLHYLPEDHTVEDEYRNPSLKKKVFDQPLPLPAELTINSLSSNPEYSPSDRVLQEMDKHGLWYLERVKCAFITFVSDIPPELPKWVKAIMDQHDWWECVLDSVVEYLFNAILGNPPQYGNKVMEDYFVTSGAGVFLENLSTRIESDDGDDPLDFLLDVYTFTEEAKNQQPLWKDIEEPAVKFLSMAISNTLHPKWVLDLMDTNRNWWKHVWEPLFWALKKYMDDYDCV